MFAFTIVQAQYPGNTAKPTIMVDSVQVPYNSLGQINPQSINTVVVLKNKQFPDGVIYITLKDPKQMQTILKSKKFSLQDLANKYIEKADKGKPILYIMNHDLVTDTSNFRILSDLYYSVAVVKAKDSPYFKKAFPNTVLLMVSTQVRIK